MASAPGMVIGQGPMLWVLPTGAQLRQERQGCSAGPPALLMNTTTSASAFAIAPRLARLCCGVTASIIDPWRHICDNRRFGVKTLY